MANTADGPENNKVVSRNAARTGRTVRRVVHCRGARGVLARRGGVWSVGNESELRVLAALGGGGDALARLEALAATLNAGLVETEGLRELNRILDLVADADWRATFWDYDSIRPALGFACAVLADHGGARWLGWALSARLDANLLRGCLPGPGLVSFEDRRDRQGRLYASGYDRDVRWLTAMPPQFWAMLDGCDRCGPAGEAFCVATRRGERPCLRALRTASDPATRPLVLKALARTWDQAVRDLVASHPNTPPKTLLEIATGLGEEYVRWRVAQNKQASPWLLRRLANHHSPVLRGIAAEHPNMPKPPLERLAGDAEVFVRARAALHPEAPAPILERLAQDPDKQVRANAASHPSCPPQMLQRLLRDRIGAVRAAAVSNPNTPPQSAAELAQDRVIAVRAAVGYRTDTVGDTLAALADDDKWQVRLAAAWNHHTPPQTLAELARCPEQQVRHWASINPSLPSAALAELARHGDFWTRASAASSPALPSNLAAKLASDPDPHVRGCLATNESTAPAALEALAGDDIWWVRRSTAENPAAPEAALIMLAGDDEAEVRAAVSANPSTPPQALQALTGDSDYRARYEAHQNLKKRAPTQHQENQP